MIRWVCSGTDFRSFDWIWPWWVICPWMWVPLIRISGFCCRFTSCPWVFVWVYCILSWIFMFLGQVCTCCYRVIWPFISFSVGGQLWLSSVHRFWAVCLRVIKKVWWRITRTYRVSLNSVFRVVSDVLTWFQTFLIVFVRVTLFLSCIRLLMSFPFL